MNDQKKPALNLKKIEKRLQLNKETISRLQAEQMQNIIGGAGSYTNCPTYTGCTIGTFNCPTGITICGG